MFPTGGLIVFCGLLAGLPLPGGHALPWTLTPAVDSGPTDLAKILMSALSNDLLSEGLLDTLENLPLLDILKTEGRTSGGLGGGLVGGLLGKVISVVPLLKDIIDVQITNAQLLELGFVQKADGHVLYTNIPLGFVLNVKTPLVGSLLKLAVRLNITAEVIAVRNKQGEIHLVVGDCSHSPGSLDISLLEGVGSLPIQNLVDSLSGVLTKVLPDLVQGKVCPLLNEVLKNLDMTLVHDTADKLISGLTFVKKI